VVFVVDMNESLNFKDEIVKVEEIVFD
jgi:hypothetical protein